MRFIISIVASFFIYLNTQTAQILNQVESFNDCSDNSWAIIAESNSESSWNCTIDSEESVLRLRGSSTDFTIWLVSELISLDQLTMPYLSFKYKNAIVNGDLELLYSTDFNGEFSFEKVGSSTWSDIPINLYPIGNDNEISNAAFHPAISLGFLKGESVYFAFRFKSASGEFDLALDEVYLNSDYYSRIQSSIKSGNRCGDLKTDLTELIQDHQVIPYTDRTFDIWDSHFTTDLRQNDAGDKLIIWDMYGDNPNGTDPYEYIAGEDKDFGEEIELEGLYYNREHSFPKSWWGGDTKTVQYSDIHYVIPADKVVNTIRLNFPYGETDNAITETANGSKMGISSIEEYTREVFEPIDEYKGDVARMHLYVATRYGVMAADWKNEDSRGQRILSGEEHTFFVEWYLNLLLKWHRQDPVSQKELDRNNAVFSIQKNRNPFIDHPEYADLIWGDQDGTVCDMVTSASELVFAKSVAIQPNPVYDHFTVITEIEIDVLNVFDLNGKLVLTQEYKSNVWLEGLEKGMYILQLLSKEQDQIYSQKLIKL